MKRRPILTIALVLMAVGVMIGISRWVSPVPAFKDGDIVFQTSGSNQSSAIMAATRSLYSHMGIIRMTAKGPVVIEATGPVKETPLKVWMRKGWRHRIAVYRDPDLTKTQAANIFAAAQRLYGKKYDLHFSFDNDSVYCSELVYDAYGAAGLSIGKVETIGALGMDLGFAKSLLNRRILSDPDCKNKGLTGKACLVLVRKRRLITPASIARDPQLKQVYSNYPF